jgi:hypothetical protein
MKRDPVAESSHNEIKTLLVAFLVFDKHKTTLV